MTDVVLLASLGAVNVFVAAGADVNALIAAQANANARDPDGSTPLMYAAERSREPEVIMILLSAGADGKLTSAEGLTAFGYARSNVWVEGTEAYRLPNEARFDDE